MASFNPPIGLEFQPGLKFEIEEKSEMISKPASCEFKPGLKVSPCIANVFLRRFVQEAATKSQPG